MFRKKTGFCNAGEISGEYEQCQKRRGEDGKGRGDQKKKKKETNNLKGLHSKKKDRREETMGRKSKKKT